MFKYQENAPTVKNSSEVQNTIQQFVENHHTQNLYDTIKNFYKAANPSDFIEANNDLLNDFLAKGFEEDYDSEYIQKPQRTKARVH